MDALNKHAGIAQHPERPASGREAAGEAPAPRSTSAATGAQITLLLIALVLGAFFTAGHAIIQHVFGASP